VLNCQRAIICSIHFAGCIRSSNITPARRNRYHRPKSGPTHRANVSQRQSLRLGTFALVQRCPCNFRGSPGRRCGLTLLWQNAFCQSSANKHRLEHSKPITLRSGGEGEISDQMSGQGQGRKISLGANRVGTTSDSRHRLQPRGFLRPRAQSDSRSPPDRSCSQTRSPHSHLCKRT
jgi:hypothetical protein